MLTSKTFPPCFHRLTDLVTGAAGGGGVAAVRPAASAVTVNKMGEAGCKLDMSAWLPCHLPRSGRMLSIDLVFCIELCGIDKLFGRRSFAIINSFKTHFWLASCRLLILVLA